jgi:hypothetical protein
MLGAAGQRDFVSVRADGDGVRFGPTTGRYGAAQGALDSASGSGRADATL